MINNVDVNNRLLQIYSEKWTELCKALDKLEGNCGQNYENNPLLLRVDDCQKYSIFCIELSVDIIGIY